MTATAAPSLQMSVICPQCDGEVEHVNGRTNGSLSIAIVRCVCCHCEWEITCRIGRHKVPR